ncbi:MAG: zinc-dependent metalloprotease family protein [Saprospiraceae bacterium]
MYRLALACTGEYGTYHGGTKALVLAEMNTAMNRINGIYERDLAVTMQLIPNNDAIIYLNGANDPYTNGSNNLLGENQTNVDNVIGDANYDIGHIFGTGDGGVASLRSVCNSGTKARGMTALQNPTGDPFYVDYVAHEMGHSFGANHSFNNSCNRNRVSAAAVEPGSGSTIMSYAGICPPNVQGQVDDYFHAYNLVEMNAFIVNGPGNNCAVRTNSGNSQPQAFAPVDRTLPVNTPFVLTGSATDADGTGSLTYNWEQMDNEIVVMPPSSSNNGGPAFRSVNPIPSPSRYFPNLQTLTSGGTDQWEVLPSVARIMEFRFQVRDNNPGAGCTAEDDIILNFADNADNFHVLAPNGGETWNVGDLKTITWDVANTTASPVSCTNVDILLSTDGGFTYPVVLANDVPNNGSYQITVPNNVSNNARVFVKCASNYFFDISDSDFAIEEPLVPTFVFNVDPISNNICGNNNAVYTLTLNPLAGFSEMTTLSITGLPTGATVSYSQNPVMPGVPVTITIQNLGGITSGNYPLTLNGVSASENKSFNLELNLFDGAPSMATLNTPSNGMLNAPTEVSFTWSAQADAAEYIFELATNPGFGASVVNTQTTSDNTVDVSGLNQNVVYYWRVQPKNPCGNGPFGTTYAFRTENPTCQTFVANDLPVSIFSASAGSYTSSLNVPQSFNITDLNVFVKINHTWVGDLEATIEGPNGTTRTLFDRPGVPADQFGCGENNINVLFDDAASNTSAAFEATCNTNQQYAIDGTYRSVQSLNTFNNSNINGNWTLTVTDNAPDDGGEIVEWYIEGCKLVTPTVVPTLVNNNALSLMEGETKTIGNTLLSAISSGSNPSQITYVIRTLPQFGDLKLAGFTLAPGDIFTQAEINSGFLSYTHTGGAASTTDDFVFEVFNNGGGWLAGSVFNINILTNNLSITTAITQTLDCFNDNDGEITATATGGTNPLNYSLNGGTYQASNVFSGLSAGTYTVTVKDANDFTRTAASIQISNPTQLSVSASVNATTVTATGNGGTGSLEYSINGTDFQASNVFNNVAVGNYTLTVRDQNGCTATAPFVVAGSNLAVNLTKVQDITCNNENDGIVEALAGGGNTPYEYSLNGGNYQSSNRFENLAAGDYTVDVRDNSGTIIGSNTITIVNPPALVLTVNVNMAEATLNAMGGTGTYRFSINGTDYQAGNVFSNIQNGTYTGYVRDENGCIETAIFQIAVNNIVANLTVISNVSCNGDSDGVIEATAIGGNPPYTFSIDGNSFQSTSIFNNLPVGTYTVTVQDNDGLLQNTNQVTITDPDPISVSTSVVGYDITVTAMGGTAPFTYSLESSPLSSTNVFTVFATGVYNGIVRDANGCEEPYTVSVDVDPLTVNVNITNEVLCFNDSTASVNVQANGGLDPYEYSIDGINYQSSPDFTGLKAGTYTIYIRDSGGNTNSTMITISEPNPLTFGYDFVGGDLQVYGIGGASGYQFSFAGQPYSTATIYPDVMPGETIRVIVKDNNSCEYQELVTVPIVTLTRLDATDVVCFGEANGTISIIINGGISPITYSLDSMAWQNFGVFENLDKGDYSVYVRDGGGFYYSWTASIDEPEALVLTDVSVAGNDVTMSAMGGVLPYSYSIDGVNYQSSNIFTDVPGGDYLAYVEDANGCLDTFSFKVVGLNDLAFDLEFNVLPNPGDGHFQIKMNQITGKQLEVKVFDVTGKLQFNQSFEKSGPDFLQEIDLSNKNAGSYLIVVTDGTMIGRRQLLIMK